MCLISEYSENETVAKLCGFTVIPAMQIQCAIKHKIFPYHFSEDGYCDLDDIRPPVAASAAADFAPVQGQRRNTGKKSKPSKKVEKDKNCKQQ